MRRIKNSILCLATVAALAAPAASSAAGPATSLSNGPRATSIDHIYCYWKKVSDSLEVLVCEEVKPLAPAPAPKR